MSEATTADDRAAVFRFWYSVYVEEMGRYRGIADHDRRELREPEDDRSRILFARDGDEVVGAYRLSWGGSGFSERQIREYSLQEFLDELPHDLLIIGERNMVAASHRGGSVYADLALLAGPIAEELGAVVAFGACEPHLVSYYARFNNQPYAMRQFWSEESGYLIPLVSLNHPEVFGVHSASGGVPACIQRVIRGDSAVRNGDVIGMDAYMAELRDALAPLSNSLSLFSALDGDDVERCCVRSSLITCATGDQIFRIGGTARNPFMVVSGVLEERRDGRVVRELHPGDVFGESGWFEDDDRRADAFVVEDGSRILALSLGTLRRLADDDPSLASKITKNAEALLASR